MAFDFTKLDGYKPEMSPEEKLALLDKYEAARGPDLIRVISRRILSTRPPRSLPEAKGD